MMSGVMDPSLELQQLASEALNYQTAQQLSQQPTTQYVTTDVSDPANPEAKFVCPFTACNRYYKRKDLLKRHLTTLLASPDENHRDEAVWEHVRGSGVMTVYTRPRNLTEDQKKQRRRESNLRHRVKYATELKEKRNRKRRVEKLLEGKQVGVQTPDWEVEAREQAAMMAVAQMAAGLPPPDPVPVPISVSVEPEPPRRPALDSETVSVLPPPNSRVARRGGRSKRLG